MRWMRCILPVVLVTGILAGVGPAAAYIWVSIDVTDSQDPATGFSEYTYAISYQYNTPIAGTATIIDNLPPEVTFKSATGGGTYESATHSVHWEVPQTLGDTVSVTVSPDQVPVPPCDVQQPSSVVIQNTASISRSTESATDTEFTTVILPVPVCSPEFPSPAVPVAIGIVISAIACVMRRRG